MVLNVQQRAGGSFHCNVIILSLQKITDKMQRQSYVIIHT